MRNKFETFTTNYVNECLFFDERCMVFVDAPLSFFVFSLFIRFSKRARSFAFVRTPLHSRSRQMWGRQTIVVFNQLIDY